MGLIAFVSQATTFACMWGSFAVLLSSVESRLDIPRSVSTLGVPLVSIGSVLLAPLAGIAARRFSLRSLMMLGALLSAAGYICLAEARTSSTYLLAFAVFVGPGMCLDAVVLPSALVARWFVQGRGRVLGFINVPVGIVVMPLLASYVLRRFGLHTVYMSLGCVMASLIIPQWFIVDFPNASGALPGAGAEIPESVSRSGPSIGALLRAPVFWTLILGPSALIAGQILFSAHMVAMAMQWGWTAVAGARLLSLTSLTGIAGALASGWLSDRVGGSVALLIACLDSVCLWTVLMSNPPAWLAASAVALICFHGAAAHPLLGVSLAELYGQDGFEATFGLGTLAMLPFTVAAAPFAAAVFTRTGSYRDALLVHTAFFILVSILYMSHRTLRTRFVA